MVTVSVVVEIAIVAGDALDDAALSRVMAPADAVVNTVGILAESGAQRFDRLQAGRIAWTYWRVGGAA